jgi:hypothetical protein
MNRRTAALLALLATLAGCATEPPPKPQFIEAPTQTLAPPPADRAQVVFLEPINSIQGLFPVGIFEVDGDSRTLIATTGAHSKASVLLPPGRHMLLATQGGGVGHFLEANVEAGKRYYVLVRFIYANGFQLRPLRSGASSDYSVTHKDFPNWMASTRLVNKTPDSDAFFEKNKSGVAAALAAGWKSWLAKTPDERAELTLTPRDAVAY